MHRGGKKKGITKPKYLAVVRRVGRRSRRVRLLLNILKHWRGKVIPEWGLSLGFVLFLQCWGI